MGGILQVDTIQNNNASNLITQTNVTTITIGASGQTISIPAGATLNTTTVVLAAGAVGTPSLTTSGDTNTGIFFSTTDTIDFAEGGVATGQFDSSGNFKFNSGYGSVGTAYGCRAWINFNGTGTPAIRGSGNVSSITDNGTGNYTVNFTTAMPDVNYCANTSAADATLQGDSPNGPVSLTTTSVTVLVYIDTSNTFVDRATVCVSILR